MANKYVDLDCPVCGQVRPVQRGSESRSTQCIECYRHARKHGHARHDGSKTGAYKSWLAMRSRCGCKSDVGYTNYGGAGVSICARWNNYMNFYEDLGDRPMGLTLDRIDPFGNYEPENCRWATKYEQTHNQRRHRAIGA